MKSRGQCEKDEYYKWRGSKGEEGEGVCPFVIYIAVLEFGDKVGGWEEIDYRKHRNGG